MKSRSGNRESSSLTRACIRETTGRRFGAKEDSKLAFIVLRMILDHTHENDLTKKIIIYKVMKTLAKTFQE